MDRIHDRKDFWLQGALALVLLCATGLRAEQDETSVYVPEEDGKQVESPPLKFGDPETMLPKEEDVTEITPPEAVPSPTSIPNSIPAPTVAIPAKPTALPVPSALRPLKLEEIRMFILGIPPGNAFETELDRVADLDEKAVPELFAILGDTSLHWEARWFAAMALGRIGGEAARLSLESRLKDPLFLIRMAASRGLAGIGNSKSAPKLRELLSDPAMVVRASAVDALAELKDRDSVDTLVVELKAPKNFHRGRSLWVRDHILGALASIGDERAVSPIVGVLGEEDPELRMKACEALARLQPEASPSKEPQDEACAERWKSWAKKR